jgi:site-specific recombinase XerC
VFLPARLVPKLKRFLSWKRSNGQALDADAPLFLSGQGRRLSPRAAQWRFAWWQQHAGFDRRYNFHALRHSAVTNVYRASKNLFLAQRFARHASPLATIICTHPADEELAEGVRDLPC